MEAVPSAIVKTLVELAEFEHDFSDFRALVKARWRLSDDASITEARALADRLLSDGLIEMWLIRSPSAEVANVPLTEARQIVSAASWAWRNEPGADGIHVLVTTEKGEALTRE